LKAIYRNWKQEICESHIKLTFKRTGIRAYKEWLCATGDWATYFVAVESSLDLLRRGRSGEADVEGKTGPRRRGEPCDSGSITEFHQPRASTSTHKRPFLKELELNGEGNLCVNWAGGFGLHHPAFLNDKVNRLDFISTVSVTSSPPDLHNSTFKLLFAHSCQFVYTIHDAIRYSCSLPGESLPRPSSTSQVAAGNSADPNR
jgi:hypothetical protein